MTPVPLCHRYEVAGGEQEPVEKGNNSEQLSALPLWGIAKIRAPYTRYNKMNQVINEFTTFLSFSHTYILIRDVQSTRAKQAIARIVLAHETE